MSSPTTIGEALEGVTEADFEDDATETETETAEETTEAEGAESGDGDDDWGTTTEGEGESGEGEAAEGDAEPQDPENAVFDKLTPEMLAKIKASPELSTVYKSLTAAATKKFQQAGEAMRLVESYNTDPDRFIRAIANANGYRVIGPNDAPETPAQPTPATPATPSGSQELDEAAAELERLFGEKVGPQVRAVFEKFVEARAGKQVAPLKESMERVLADGEKARAESVKAQMLSEEQAFIARHKGVVNRDIYNKVVALGKSGRIQPGKDMKAGEWLDTLLDLVLAKEGGFAKGRTEGARRLAERIKKNRETKEPTGMGSRSGVKPVSAVRPDMSISEAIDAAAREMESEGR